jgi:hypothetical protein
MQRQRFADIYHATTRGNATQEAALLALQRGRHVPYPQVQPPTHDALRMASRHGDGYFVYKFCQGVETRDVQGVFVAGHLTTPAAVTALRSLGCTGSCSLLTDRGLRLPVTNRHHTGPGLKESPWLDAKRFWWPARRDGDEPEGNSGGVDASSWCGKRSGAVWPAENDHIASIYAWCDAMQQAIATFNTLGPPMTLEEYDHILDIIEQVANHNDNLERVWVLVNTLRSVLTTGLVTRRQSWASIKLPNGYQQYGRYLAGSCIGRRCLETQRRTMRAAYARAVRVCDDEAAQQTGRIKLALVAIAQAFRALHTRSSVDRQ